MLCKFEVIEIIISMIIGANPITPNKVEFLFLFYIETQLFLLVLDINVNVLKGLLMVFEIFIFWYIFRINYFDAFIELFNLR